MGFVNVFLINCRSHPYSMTPTHSTVLVVTLSFVISGRPCRTQKWLRTSTRTPYSGGARSTLPRAGGWHSQWEAAGTHCCAWCAFANTAWPWLRAAKALAQRSSFYRGCVESSLTMIHIWLRLELIGQFTFLLDVERVVKKSSNEVTWVWLMQIWFMESKF